MPRSLSAPDLLHADDTTCIAHRHNVQVAVCARVLRLEHVRIIEDGYRTLGRSYPDGVLGLVVLLPHPPPTDRAVLQALQRMIRDLGPLLLRIAVVIDFDGLAGTLLRAILRGLGMAARSGRIVHLYGGLDEALRALLPQVRARGGEAPQPNELQQLVAALRTRLGREAAAR